MRLFLGLRVVSQVIGLRRYASLFAVLSASFSALYLVLLPTLPFGAFVLQAIMFITPVQVVFAVVLGVLLALLVTLNVYARRLGGAYVGVAPAGSVLAGLVNALCCTPIIHTILGLLGGFSPIIYTLSPHLEYFFEEYYWVFYIFSAAILVYALFRVSRSIACCVPNYLAERRENAH